MNDTTDDIGYVDDALYQEIISFADSVLDYHGFTSTISDSLPAQTVLREARLLDSRHYDLWLEQYASQCAYWVPGKAAVGDPRTEPTIHFDDHRRLADRVALIQTGFLHAQTPPSRTCRMVTNIEQLSDSVEHVDIASCLTIHEYRRGSSHSYIGRQWHRLVQHNEQWQIRFRLLLLLDRDAAQGNITFIL